MKKRLYELLAVVVSVGTTVGLFELLGDIFNLKYSFLVFAVFPFLCSFTLMMIGLCIVTKYVKE